jgi:peptide/nickel transport system substrate-binding protein
MHRLSLWRSKSFSNSRLFVLILPLMLCCLCCSRGAKEQTGKGKDYIVIAIQGDVDSFNPLFAEDVTAGEINDLIFPGLVDSKFDTARGVLDYQPLLAKSWEYRNDNRDIVFHMRTDAKWSDGVSVTARDVQLSYELYGDTLVASVRQSSVEGLLKSKEGRLQIHEAVEVVNDSTVVFHYERPYAGQLFDAGLPIMPAHVYGKLPRQALRENPVNQNPIGSGPFLLKSWKPLQEIILESSPTSVLPCPARLARIIFRVIPDTHTRLAQLRSGEVDLVANVRVEDAIELQKSSQLRVIPTGERVYDALNWNNLDPKEYAETRGRVIRPHPLFGDASVRRALTLATNRKEIVQSYLRAFGCEAIGPVSPLFRWAYNDTLKPLPYDPVAAAALLAECGWRDTDGDGVLDKGGRRFSFVLKITAGDQLRSNIASIVQDELHALKIDVRVEQVERSVFWKDLMQKRYDAWISGFSVPLQMQLDEMWGSDLRQSPFNLVSFRNKRVDEILKGAKRIHKETEYASAWKEFQVILYDEQPCTFLYWLNGLVAINRRVHGTKIGVLGTLHHAWEWHVEPQLATK